MLINESKFQTKGELFKFLVANKASLIAQKKAENKNSDGFDFTGDYSGVFKKLDVNKANDNVENPSDILNVIAVINTTNLMDSHKDVHIPGIWSKTLAENKSIMHLQEHRLAFDKIISDGPNLKAYAKSYSWGELGFNYPGTTEALVFDSKILKSRNPFMHDQYARGYVKQHSVGMRYVKIVLCINSDESYYGAEKEAWDKYIEMVANKSDAEDSGYFWAVTEAKVMEGSAVPLGSNFATPTLENNKTEEPEKSTHENTEPESSTQKVDYNYLINNF